MYLKQKLGEVCTKHGERVLETSHNPISLGYTVHTDLRSLLSLLQGLLSPLLHRVGPT